MKNVIKTLCLLVGIVLTPHVMAQQIAKGFVYEDTNMNGKQDQQEPGLANILVTNGVEVVKTNTKGYYEIPVNNDAIIQVIKPGNYNYLYDSFFLPKFFYNHKPHGSPTLKYAGVAPTGDLPKSIDFGLIKQEIESSYRVLLMGDPQPYTLEEMGYFRDKIVNDLKAYTSEYEFGITLGDIVGDDLDLFAPYKQVMQALEKPWFNVMGNHDMNYDVKEDHLSDETFEREFGPANYAFFHGEVLYIMIDNILYPDPRGVTQYWGGLRKDQKKWIRNVLKHVPNDKLVVVSMHIPLSEPDADTYRDQDRSFLLQELARFENSLSLSAHTHLQKQDFFGWEEGYLKPYALHHHYNVGTTSGDWYSGQKDEKGLPNSMMRDGTPSGYAFLEINGTDYDISYKVAGKSDQEQIGIFVPKEVKKADRSRHFIHANFYLGSKFDSLEFRIDNGKWIKMHKVEQTDPQYVNQLFEWYNSETAIADKRPSEPVISQHLWRARLPVNLPEGEHTIEVRAKHFLGKTYTNSKTYRIVN